MTDKQIIARLKTDLDFERTKRKSLQADIKAKERECEKIKNWVKGMMFYTDCSNWFERFTTAFEDWKNDLTSQLDQLKAENEELKKKIKYMEEYIKTVENSRNEFEKESKFLKEEI